MVGASEMGVNGGTLEKESGAGAASNTPSAHGAGKRVGGVKKVPSVGPSSANRRVDGGMAPADSDVVWESG